jgi:hypothetical protein
MKVQFLIILLFYYGTVSLAQENELKSISGIVEGKTAIEGAHCYLKNNEHLGSVTDSTGFFNFVFGQSLIYDTLVISSIGYQRKIIPLRSVSLDYDTNYFSLKQHTLILDELLIESSGYNLKNFVLAALVKMPENYPDQQHQMKGLYRKVSTEGKKYTHLEEAIVKIEDNGYKKPLSNLKIESEAFRESKEWGNTDSLFIRVNDKFNKHLSQKIGTTLNPLHKLYESNIIRHYRNDHTVFNFNAMQKLIDDHYSFELTDISVLDGDTIYHIAFASSPVPPPPDRPNDRNYIKINTSDMAIIEVQLTIGFENEPLIGQKKIIYQKIAGKYYPKIIKEIRPRLINKEFHDYEYDIYTFWIDQVNTGKFKKIKAKNRIDPNELEDHKEYKPNSDLWKSSGLLDEYPLEKGIKDDLDSYQPLEQQFEEQGQ